jgi:hypothetical protein
MSGRLWNYFDGEPYLDNPYLRIFNPQQRRKKTMAKARRRYHVKRNPPRRRRYRRNIYVPLANPHRRRRRYTTNPRRRRHHFFARNHRRRYRRNPPMDFLGFRFKDVAIAGGAVVIAPFIEKQLLGLLPTSMTGTTGGLWAVKIGTAVATGYAAKMLLGQDASRLAFIALGANLVADAVAQFAPSLMPAPAAGYYTAGLYVPGPSAGGGFRSLGAGPNAGMLGYVGLSGRAGVPMMAQQDPFTPVF